MNQLDTRAADRGLLQRICGEYREMPGLQLTIAQACRLWNVDRDTSLDVLNTLVAERFLCVRRGLYRRADAA